MPPAFFGGLAGDLMALGDRLGMAVQDMIADAADAPAQLGQAGDFLTGGGLSGSIGFVLAAAMAAMLAAAAAARGAGRLLAPVQARLRDTRPASLDQRLLGILWALLVDLVPAATFLAAALVLAHVLFWDRGLLFVGSAGFRLVLIEAVLVIAAGWLGAAVLALPIADGRPGLRLLPLTDAEARTAHRYVWGLVALATIARGLAWSVYLLRFGTGVPHMILIAAGVVVGAACLAGLRHMPPRLTGFARHWRNLAVLSVFGLNAVWIAGVLLDPEPPVDRVAATVAVLAVMPLVDGIVQLLLKRLRQRLLQTPGRARRIFVPSGDDDALHVTAPAADAGDAVAAVSDAVDRLVGVLRDAAGWAIAIAAGLVLARSWSVDLPHMMGPRDARALPGMAFDAGLTLLLGWYAWRLFERTLALRMAREGAGAPSRAQTVQPLLRSVGQLVIGAVAAMTALSSLGINIAPLLASAGVVGIAVGFGAQTLVRDLFSGAFYLVEDAFRIGDYIEGSGGSKGTVERITFRTVALRHHNGPLHFVPYGMLGAVRNHSRDWVIDKFELPLPIDVDSEKVRKMVKRIGEAMLDSEVAVDIVEPLKAKLYRIDPGVKVFRCKVQTPPGRQFEVRAEALKRIEAALRDAGIPFADSRPVVTFMPSPPAPMPNPVPAPPVRPAVAE